MFATEWVFTLFGNLVPCEAMVDLLDKFFDRGWVFFYQVVLEILSRLEPAILSKTDIGEILTLLKPCQRT
jgi:hypothetical protein